MASEGIGTKQYGQVGAMLGVQDAPQWRCEYLVEKYWKANDAEHRAGDREIVQGVGNLLMNAGAGVMWERLINPAALTSAGGKLCAYSTNSKIGVSTSNTAAAANQTALQGTNKFYSSMAATYPLNSTAASTAARTCAFRSVFTTSQANVAWNEWAIFNGTATGTMLNRKVQSLGTKTCAAQWTFTASLTLS